MRTSVLVAVAASAALITAVPATAHADPPVVRDAYSFTDSGTFDDCGITIDFEEVGSGRFSAKEIPGSDGQAFLGTDNYRFRSVFTNVANGQWMVIRGNGMFKEMSGTQVDGDIWEFTAMDVGQPFVVEDSAGKVVLRDRGRLTFRALFDTLGDGEVGGELIEQELTGRHGKHPGFDTDFCDIVDALIT